MTPPTPDLEKTGAALSQESLKLQVSNLGTVIKMVADGRPDQFFGVFGRPLVQVDAQFDRSFRGEFLGPAHDEFFRVVVEILSMNGEGSIELKSWFMSRSFRLMVWGCARSAATVSSNEKCIGRSLLSSVYHMGRRGIAYNCGE